MNISSLIFIHRAQFFLIFRYAHDALGIVDPYSMQDACHI